MPKKLKTIAKNIIKGVIGGTKGAALKPILRINKLAADTGTIGLGVLECGPNAIYGFARGAQVAACKDGGGINKVTQELVNFDHSKPTALGSNFFNFYSQEAKEQRKEKRIVVHHGDTEEKKIKKTIEVIDHLRTKDESKKHARSLFSLFPSELVVEVAAAQREALDKDEASTIAMQHYANYKG